jgi:hypothetical protein
MIEEDLIPVKRDRGILLQKVVIKLKNEEDPTKNLPHPSEVQKDWKRNLH